MSFPAGWTQEQKNYIPNHEWHRDVDPTAASLAYTLMTLPADTKINYAVSDGWGETPVTHIVYDDATHEAILS